MLILHLRPRRWWKARTPFHRHPPDVSSTAFQYRVLTLASSYLGGRGNRPNLQRLSRETRRRDRAGIGAYHKHANLCLVSVVRLLPTRRPASRSSPGVSRGRLGLLVPLLVWPHFSSNTSITAGVAASAPPLSERRWTEHGGRLAYLCSAPR
jgi:hypothetical protein